MDRHELVEINNVETVKNVDKETRNWVYAEYGK